MYIITAILRLLLLVILSGLFVGVLGKEKPINRLHCLFCFSARVVGYLLLMLASVFFFIWLLQLAVLIKQTLF